MKKLTAVVLGYGARGSASKSIAPVRMSYLSHLIAFAAEESRLTDKVIDLDTYSAQF